MARWYRLRAAASVRPSSTATSACEKPSIATRITSRASSPISLPHGAVQPRVPGRADPAVAAVRHLVGIGAAGEMFARRVALARADHVALDVPQDRGRDPVDAPQVEAADRLGGARQHVGRDLVGGADPAPDRPAADGVEAGPERQQQQRQGAVGRGPVALRRL